MRGVRRGRPEEVGQTVGRPVRTPSPLRVRGILDLRTPPSHRHLHVRTNSGANMCRYDDGTLTREQRFGTVVGRISLGKISFLRRNPFGRR